jgi:hypothetical protein
MSILKKAMAGITLLAFTAGAAGAAGAADYAKAKLEEKASFFINAGIDEKGNKRIYISIGANGF